MNRETIVDVVLPTYYPGRRLAEILRMLQRQTVPVRCIRIINTEEEGFRRFLEREEMSPEELRAEYPELRIRHIGAEDFDHAATRAEGFRECGGADYVLTMTQDALPADEHLVEELLRPLEGDGKAAVSYARQLPNPGAMPEEILSRAFNYPAESCVKSWEDRDRLGIKTFFCSDVCALYRLDLWLSLGGFPERAIFNEDMIYACRALQAGNRICYAAEARVFHSHTYTARQQFCRNFDLGVSQAQNPEVFEGLASEKEGLRYVKAVVRQLQQEGKAGMIPGFLVRCAARLTGYRLGRSYERLPQGLVKRCSANQVFWMSENTGK